MPVDTRLLPPVMRGLIEAVGFEQTIKLLRARGGQRVHIPLTASRWLVGLVGIDAAQRLCERWGGQDLDVPKFDKVAQQLRNESIRLDRGEHSLNELAAKYCMTRRHVQNIVRTEEPGEPDLFGFS